MYVNIHVPIHGIPFRDFSRSYQDPKYGWNLKANTFLKNMERGLRLLMHTIKCKTTAGSYKLKEIHL
jgi:hypothetical protein